MIKNRKTIYIITIVFSAAMIVVSESFPNTWREILIGTGCSLLSAGIIAIFIDMSDESNKRDFIKRVRNICFLRLSDEVHQLMERILWIEDRIEDDEVYWGLNPECCITKEFVINEKIKHTNYDILFLEAELRLLKFSERVENEALLSLDADSKRKIDIAFMMLGISFSQIYAQIQLLNADKFILLTEGIVTEKDIDGATYNLELAGELFIKTRSYAMGIRLIIDEEKHIRSLCDCTKKNAISWLEFINAYSRSIMIHM